MSDARNLSDEALEKTIADKAARSTVIDINYYLDEQRYRNQKKTTDIMLKYTNSIKWMTIVITIATIINLVITLLRCY